MHMCERFTMTSPEVTCLLVFQAMLSLQRRSPEEAAEAAAAASLPAAAAAAAADPAPATMPNDASRLASDKM